MKRKLKKRIYIKKWDIIQKIFIPLSSALYILWLFAIFLQFVQIVLVSKDFTLLRDYGQITLTIFGFALIGGIFEKNKSPSLIEIKLFDTSISFLIASISFFYLYSILPLYISEDVFVFGSFPERLVFISIVFTMFLAFYGLISGFINFLRYLIDYRKSVSDTPVNFPP
jgi:hypothetical protein